MKFGNVLKAEIEKRGGSARSSSDATQLEGLSHLANPTPHLVLLTPPRRRDPCSLMRAFLFAHETCI